MAYNGFAVGDVVLTLEYVRAPFCLQYVSNLILFCDLKGIEKFTD